MEQALGFGVAMKWWYGHSQWQSQEHGAKENLLVNF